MILDFKLEYRIFKYNKKDMKENNEDKLDIYAFMAFLLCLAIALVLNNCK